VRKRLLIAGIVVLVIGIVFAGISVAESAREIKEAGTAVYLGQNGDHYSNLLTVSSTEEITVVSSVNAYLIPSQDLNLINSSNIVNYKISPSESTGNTSLYSGLNGSYYVVTFGTATPKVEYAVLNVSGGLIAVGLLLIAGALLIIVGIILAIIGAVLKPKGNPRQQF
jgi:uncharacterized membrane protein